MEKIIDISEHNGNVNFLSLKAEGISKVIIRLGWIGNKENHTLDNKFQEYMAGAIHAGFKIGIYVYNYCKSISAIESGARWTIENLKNFKDYITLPVFLDLEDETIAGLSNNDLTNMGQVFCNRMKENGYDTGIYANKYWWTTKLNVEVLKAYKIWLAQYANIQKPNVLFDVDLWQYTSSGKVSGISGNVDLNYCLKCENISQEEMTGEVIQESEGYEMKVYQNGSTKETVYQDMGCTRPIGYLFPRETAVCYGIVGNVALVVYDINNKTNKKAGFVKWLGGVK